MRHSTKLFHAAGSAALCATFALAAVARDSSDGFALPGLTSDPPGSVTPKDTAVRVAGAKITVDVAVSTGTDIPGLVVQGAPFGPAAATEPYPERHFPELEVSIDGGPVQVEEFTAAFVGNKNIMLFVREAHLDPWAITRSPPWSAAEGANPRALKALAGLGAIEKSGDGYLARWAGRRGVRIPLYKGRDQQVELRYTARPAFAPATVLSVVTPARERDYCLSEAALRRFAHSLPATQPLTVHEYSIAAGIDDSAPASVTLEMSAADGGRIASRAWIFACGPHRKAIAAVGNVKRQAAQVDEHARLRVLSIVESTPEN